ncbi:MULTISPECIES: hypothetical protein [unclassified Pseudomonas]|nr:MULTISPECIES: hypothetical protein [unclassified Pseudomonas]
MVISFIVALGDGVQQADLYASSAFVGAVSLLLRLLSVPFGWPSPKVVGG